MILALAGKSRMNQESMNRHFYLAGLQYYEKMLARALDNTSPIFSHSDLQRKNGIVKKVNTRDGSADLQVSLMGWEYVGWYPAYWDFVAAFLAPRWDDDWSTTIMNAWTSGRLKRR
ncbi:hypothetical protein A1O7_09481 [Cladophialophora yegresii CBS 114405]|uniref:Aminoglycoside phosphotransferase domain-containing protein n=1 Tax=Cladophialophora yegresii CBS 114405 TaxID=1182544 RepID=W9W6G2_9EURO|nr:uncharacterized protein A1O7_09481 [Cladophialophora yegresii CBS 114405]EXJ54144.1 hypothetical protein A1O7_09481 [Cladophialophora yegresii CBS 114405]